MIKVRYMLIFFILLLPVFILTAANTRDIIIEDFNDGEVQLESWLDEDYDPDSWVITDENQSIDPPYSLALYGNTWKVQTIAPHQIDYNSVWSVQASCTNLGEIQGIGFSDGENTLYYSFWGQQELNIEIWIPVYQGNYETDQWQEFLLPLGDDWFAWYEYYPTITEVIYINDNDSGSGMIYLDYLRDVTEDLPQCPVVTISCEQESVRRNNNGTRTATYQFTSYVEDADSDTFNFLWQFGDDSLSTEEHPSHSYIIEDAHPYTVVLEVTDETGMIGYATINIILDEGETSLPLTMNFVGDIMLGRGIQNYIENSGGEQFFDPTYPILGAAADITIANLECPLTTHGTHHPTKSVWFKGLPEYAEFLQYAGIDVVSLANNHTLDYMQEGLADTQEALDEYGICYSGAGMDSYEAYLPVLYNKKGVNVAFLASCDRTGQYNNAQPYLQAGYNKPGFAYMTPYYIDEQLDAVADIADLKIMEMHAGSEYSTSPGSNYDAVEPDDMYPEEDYYAYADIPHMWDMEIRHHAVDSGADLVVVHHPHIVQGFEVYQGKLIAHSLGNFLFDLTYSETMPSIILNAWADKEKFTKFTITPVFIDDYIPTPATGQYGLYLLDHLAMKSKELNTIMQVDRENVTAEIMLDSLNIEENLFFNNVVVHFDEYDDEIISDLVRFPHHGSLSMIDQILPTAGWDYRLGRELIWFGNFEDEGCSLWDLNSDDEFYTEEQSHSGLRSLCQFRENNSDEIITDFEKRIKLYEAESHTIHGWVKTSNAENVYIEARYYSSRNSNWPVSTQQIEIDIPSTSDWTFYQQELDIPDNGYYLNIYLSSEGPDFSDGTTWFDDIGVVAWDEWDEYEAPEQIEAPNDYYFMQIKANSNITAAQITFTESSYHSGPIVNSFDDNIPSKPIAELYPNRPNPLVINQHRKGITMIDFSLFQPTSVKLNIYNIKGQKVKTLIDEPMEPGNYSTGWDGLDNYGKAISSGVYFYRLKTGKEEKSRKLLILK